ncbi:MAG TPA: triacylglycerol lipase [Polyangia bacterium]|jgi:triacylglycerol lipase
MKRVLANVLVAAFLTAAGCGSPSATAPTGTGGNGVPRGATNWPAPESSPPTAHRPYPIVLAHGFSGFHNIGPLNYFYGVQDALSKDGHSVFVTQVDPYNSSEVRGAQLLTQVQQILGDTGAEKVDLICHSQGGPDCRYVANKLGKQIGAVVMVAGVNRGDYVADVAAGIIQGPTSDAVQLLLSIFGATILDPGGQPDTDAQAAIAQLTTPGTLAFNAKYPDDPNVSYFSIAGRTENGRGDADCGSDTEAPFIEKWDQTTGPVNALLAATASLLDGSGSPAPTNDGLVTVASAKWGTFLGCVPADHLSEVCQIGGQSSGSDYDCVTMYRDIADWLVARGF